jgi:DNA-binding transcriptional MerR regulator
VSKSGKAAQNTSLMRIGAAAAKAGVSRQTLQYYMMVGLIKPSSRSPAGQRLFDHDAVKRIKLIRRLNRSGYTLRGIRDIFLTDKL